MCFLELLISCWQSFNVPWLIQHLCLLAHMSPLCVHVDARCYLCLLYKIISYVGWKLTLPQHDCISIPSIEIQFPNKGIFWTTELRASKSEFCGGCIWTSLLESWQKHCMAREATLFHMNLLHQQLSWSHLSQGSDFGGHFTCFTYPPSWKLLKWEHVYHTSTEPDRGQDSIWRHGHVVSEPHWSLKWRGSQHQFCLHWKFCKFLRSSLSLGLPETCAPPASASWVWAL